MPLCFACYDWLLMPDIKKRPGAGRPRGPSLFGLLKPYRRLVIVLVVMTLLGNSLSLVVPKLIAHAIDTYAQQRLILSNFTVEFFAAPGAGFDFASFSFHVPMKAESSAKHTAAATKHTKKVRTNVLVFIFPPYSEVVSGQQRLRQF